MDPIMFSTGRKGYLARNWRWLICMALIVLLAVTALYVRTATPSAVVSLHEGWYGLAMSIATGLCGAFGWKAGTLSGRAVYLVIYWGIWGTFAWLIWSYFFIS